MGIVALIAGIMLIAVGSGMVGFGFAKLRQHRSMLPQMLAAKGVDLTGVFAVPDTEHWWIAVHQIVDQAELETVSGARRVTHDPNRCLAAVGAGEGCDLIRTKLKEAREYALANYRNDIKPKHTLD